MYHLQDLLYLVYVKHVFCFVVEILVLGSSVQKTYLAFKVWFWWEVFPFNILWQLHLYSYSLIKHAFSYQLQQEPLVRHLIVF